ncbi:MAG: hypothetical protein NTZ35_08310, partial [Ignavibacteriales bacterium]|nr:hypothetical protein [Ignavibacteriales bacterium]
MTEKTDAPISRRTFFRIAATLTGSVVVAGTSFSLFSSDQGNETSSPTTIRLNPAFRIKNISKNEIDLFTHLPDGHVLSHHFTGFDADVLRQIEDGNTIAGLRATLSQAHNLSQTTCEAKLVRSLKDLEKGKLIYYGDKMIVKISET